jgi:hypothetical protein
MTDFELSELITYRIITTPSIVESIRQLVEKSIKEHRTEPSAPAYIDPGMGYRLIEPTEKLRADDQILVEGKWEWVYEVGYGHLEGPRKVRRMVIPPDPGEEHQMLPAGEIVQPGDEILINKSWVSVDQPWGDPVGTRRVRRKVAQFRSPRYRYLEKGEVIGIYDEVMDHGEWLPVMRVSQILPGSKVNNIKVRRKL